ncbi:hypothetical protein FA95DRAFT_1502103 [Auriscalpium vulgare]|uniref:Uncharacterized protein n=1 Tax=Auriscalpium vulgare TaxID=40419 RepID=A0ACB8R9X5_9AGAM|nr:hypothetical protein FA95DRAFT_1502103 [Auriscalpium vulgare]
MEQVRGVDRGSYIWGRSVHNIRIERLWVDVTAGFGKKWKEFFRGLEAYDNLNLELDPHIWLIHHLFLPAINEDAETWANTWNAHILSRRGQTHEAPRDMYTHGTVIHGQRAIFLQPEPEGTDDDLAEFGIDWNDIENRQVMNHHNAENNVQADGDPNNPFVSNQPDQLSHVEVSDARCPFNTNQLQIFNTYLHTLPYINFKDMASRRLVWISAYERALEM